MANVPAPVSEQRDTWAFAVGLLRVYAYPGGVGPDALRDFARGVRSGFGFVHVFSLPAVQAYRLSRSLREEHDPHASRRRIVLVHDSRRGQARDSAVLVVSYRRFESGRGGALLNIGATLARDTVNGLTEGFTRPTARILGPGRWESFRRYEVKERPKFF